MTIDWGTWRTDPVKHARVSTRRVGQFAFFGITKIEEALTEVLYEQGVEPEKRIKIKDEMHQRLETVAQELIVWALNKKMLDEGRLRDTMGGKKRKKRSVIIEKED